MAGWIKLHRKLKDSLVFDNPDLLKVWIWCLLKATHDDYTQMIGLQEVELKKGQFIFGRKVAANELKMSESKTYRLIKKLENMQNLNIKANNKFSVITIENWEIYQSDNNNNEQQSEQQMNNKRTTNEQQMNTNKNVKNVKEEYIDEFEIIWQLYPNKKGKAAAMKKYPSLRSKHSFEDLQRAVKKYADDVKGQDVKYIKHGSTFFNGGYLDYIEAEKPKKVVKLTPRFEDYLGNGSV